MSYLNLSTSVSSFNLEAEVQKAKDKEAARQASIAALPTSKQVRLHTPEYCTTVWVEDAPSCQCCNQEMQIFEDDTFLSKWACVSGCENPSEIRIYTCHKCAYPAYVPYETTVEREVEGSEETFTDVLFHGHKECDVMSEEEWWAEWEAGHAQVVLPEGVQQQPLSPVKPFKALSADGTPFPVGEDDLPF